MRMPWDCHETANLIVKSAHGISWCLIEARVTYMNALHGSLVNVWEPNGTSWLDTMVGHHGTFVARSMPAP